LDNIPYAFFLPVANIFSINSAIIGTFVIILPIVVLFFARSLYGITGGNVSVVNAYLADVSSEKNRSKNFGKMAISSNLGFIVGPTIAGVLGGTIYKDMLPVLAAVFISLIAIIVIGFTLKELNSRDRIQIPIQEKENIRKVFSQECK
jgi:MFS transporter, DHA1 family, tetracycline resistance protein